MSGNGRDGDTSLQLGQAGARIYVEIDPYTNIDDAAMVAARMVYRRSSKEEWTRNIIKKAWTLEYGMAIYGNNIDFRRSTIFCLGDIIEGNDQKPEVSMDNAIENPIDGYHFNAFVHSHPTSSPSVGAYELSKEDYYESIKGNNGMPFNMYLVLDLGISGMLIKFTPPPPPPSPPDNDLFLMEMNDFFYSREMITFNNREDLLEKIYYSERNTCVRVVDRIVKSRMGKLKRTFLPNGYNPDDKIAWQNLDPKAILWKIRASTITISGTGENWAMVPSGEEWSEVKSTYYDLTKTVTMLIINENGANHSIGIEQFADFTALIDVEIRCRSLNISHDAFYGCTRLTNVRIWCDNIRGIGDEAFFGCVGLTNVELRSNSIGVIGKRTFSGCTRLMRIICLSPNPPIFGEKAFNGLPKNASLYVRKEHVGGYRHGYGLAHWWKFFKIRPHRER